LQLLGDEKTILGVGKDDWRLEHFVGERFGRRLEGGMQANEGNELFRKAFARRRPDPRSRAPAHNDRKEFSRFLAPS